MNLYQRFIILSSILFFSGCTSVIVSQDYDPSKDFSGLKTYAWQTQTQEKTGDVRADNPLLDARIRAAVNATLSEMGYRMAADSTSDFYVRYQYSIRSKITSDDFRYGVGFGRGSRGRYGAIGVGTGSDLTSYDEGLLVIDFIRTGNNELIWRGMGTQPLSEPSTPEERIRVINEAVAKILSQFPPQ